MRLKELPRQIVAGLIASLSFVIAYLGLTLIWWLALGMGIAVYAAALLLIEREPEDNEVFVYDNITRFDINSAVESCRQAAEHLYHASRHNRIDTETAIAIERLSQLVEAIGNNYLSDGRDLKHSRIFISHYLPNMMAVVGDYVRLSERTVTVASQQRLQQVGELIRGYVPHVQNMYDACLENDFEKLELETSVLGEVMRITQSAN